MIDQLEQYILDHSSPEAEVLQELDRQTHLRMIQPRMLSGHLQGLLLEMIVAMIRPQAVLELGTFTGYSAIAMARALPDGAILHTVEQNDELEAMAALHIEKAGLRDRIVQHIGPALEVMPRLEGPFDLVFIDADKREYPDYYRMLFDRKLVRSGSFIVADNVLWDGKVIQPIAPNDSYARGIVAFNELVRSDERVVKVILPIRDGITLIRVN